MPKGYVIVRATVTDTAKWAEYVAKSKVALEKYQGTPIVRGGRCETVEGLGRRATPCWSFPLMNMHWATPKAKNMRPLQDPAPGRWLFDMTVVEGV